MVMIDKQVQNKNPFSVAPEISFWREEERMVAYGPVQMFLLLGRFKLVY